MASNSVDYIIRILPDTTEYKKLMAGDLLKPAELRKLRSQMSALFGDIEAEAKRIGSAVAQNLSSGRPVEFGVDTKGLKEAMEFAEGFFAKMNAGKNVMADWARQGGQMYEKFDKVERSVGTLAQNIATLQTDLNKLTESFEGFKSSYQSFDPAKFAGVAQDLDKTTKGAKKASDAVNQVVTEMGGVVAVSTKVDKKLQDVYDHAIGVENAIKKINDAEISLKGSKEATDKMKALEKEFDVIATKFEEGKIKNMWDAAPIVAEMEKLANYLHKHNKTFPGFKLFDIDSKSEMEDYIGYYKDMVKSVPSEIEKHKVRYQDALKDAGKDTSPDALLNQLKDVKLSLRVPKKSELVGQINKVIASIQPKDLRKIETNVVPVLSVDAANPIEDVDKRAQKSKNGENPASDDAVTDSLVQKTTDRFKRIEDVVDDSREKIVNKADQWRRAILEKLQLPKLDLKFDWKGDVTDNFNKLYNDIQSYFDDTPINIKINGADFAKQIEGAINEKGLTLGGGGTATIDANDIANIIKSIFTGEPIPTRVVGQEHSSKSDDAPNDTVDTDEVVESVAKLNREASQGVIDLLKRVSSKADNSKGGQNVAKYFKEAYGINLEDIDKHKYDDDIDEKIFDLLQKTLTKPDGKTGNAAGRTLGIDLQNSQWLKEHGVAKRGAKSIGFILDSLGRHLDNLLNVSGINTESSDEASRRYNRLSVLEKAREKHETYFGAYSALDKVGAKKNFNKYINNPDLLKIEDIDVAISALEEVDGDITALKKLKDARLKLGDSKDMNAIYEFKKSAYSLFDGMKEVSKWLKERMGNFKGSVNIQGRSRPMPINNPYDMAGLKKDAVVSDAVIYSAFGQNYRDNADMQARPHKQTKVENLNVTADKFHIQESSEKDLESQIAVDEHAVKSIPDLEENIKQFQQNIDNLSQQIEKFNAFIEQAKITVKSAPSSKFDDASNYANILSYVINNGRNAIANKSTFDISKEQLKQFEANDKFTGLAVQQLQSYALKLQGYTEELYTINEDIRQSEEALSLSKSELEKRKSQANTNRTGAEALHNLEILRGMTLPNNVEWIERLSSMVGGVGENSAAFKNLIAAAKNYERTDENATVVDQNTNKVIKKKDLARQELEASQRQFIEETKALFDRMTSQYGKYNIEAEDKAYNLYNRAIYDRTSVANDINNLKVRRDDINSNISSTQTDAQKILTDLDGKYANAQEKAQQEVVELAAKLRKVRQDLYDEASQYVKILRDDNTDAATREVTLAKLQQVLGGLKDTKTSFAKIGHLVPDTPLYDTKKQEAEVDKWTKEFVTKAEVSNILRAKQNQLEEKTKEKTDQEKKLAPEQHQLAKAKAAKEDLDIANQELEFVKQYNELLEKEKQLLQDISKLKRQGDWKGVKAKYNERDALDGQIRELLEQNQNDGRHAYAFNAAEQYEADIRLAASQRRIYSRQLAELKSTENEIKKSQFFTGKRGSKVLNEFEDSLAKQFYERRVKAINESYGPVESLTFNEQAERDAEIERAKKARLLYKNQLSVKDNQLILTDYVKDENGVMQEVSKVIVENLQQALLEHAQIDAKRQNIKTQLKDKNLDQTISDLYASKKEAMRYGGVTQAELNNSTLVQEQNALLKEIEQLKETKQSLDNAIEALPETLKKLQEKIDSLTAKKASEGLTTKEHRELQQAEKDYKKTERALSKAKRDRDDAEQKIADKTQFVSNRKNLIQENEAEKAANRKTAEENLALQTQRLTQQKEELKKVEEDITKLKEQQKAVEKDSPEAERIKHALTDAKAKKKEIEGYIENTQKSIAGLQKSVEYQKKVVDAAEPDDTPAKPSASGGILGAITSAVKEGVSGVTADVEIDTSHLATEETLGNVKETLEKIHALLGGDGDWEPEEEQEDVGQSRNKKQSKEIDAEKVIANVRNAIGKFDMRSNDATKAEFFNSLSEEVKNDGRLLVYEKNYRKLDKTTQKLADKMLKLAQAAERVANTEANPEVKRQSSVSDLSEKDILTQIKENLLQSQSELKELSDRITELEGSSDPNDVAAREGLIATRDKLQESVTTIQQSLKAMESADDAENDSKTSSDKVDSSKKQNTSAGGGGLIGLMRTHLAQEGTLQKVLTKLGEIAKNNAMSGKPNNAQGLLEAFRRMLESDKWEQKERMAYLDLSTGAMSNIITGDKDGIAPTRSKTLRDAYSNMDMNAKVHTHAGEDDPYFSKTDFEQAGIDFGRGIKTQILLSDNNMTVLDMKDVKDGDKDGLLNAMSNTEQNYEALAATASKFGAKYLSKSFEELIQSPMQFVKMLGIKGVESKLNESETRSKANESLYAQDAKEAASVIQKSNGESTVRMVEKWGAELRTIIESTDTKGNKKWSVELANKYEKAKMAIHQSILDENLKDQFGGQTDARKTYNSYLKTYEEWQAKIKEFKQAPDDQKVGLQAEIDKLQPKLDKLEEKLVTLIKRKDKFLGDKTAVAMFNQTQLGATGDSLRALMQQRHGDDIGMGENIATRGLSETENGSRLIFDVLKNGQISSYALEVDRVTGQVKEFMVAQNALANAFLNVNKAMQLNETVMADIASVTGLGEEEMKQWLATANSPELRAYQQAMQEMQEYTQYLWTTKQGNANQDELQHLMALSERTIQLGDNAKKAALEFQKLFIASDPTNVFRADVDMSGGDRNKSVRATLEEIAQGRASSQNKKYDFMSFDNDRLRFKLTDVAGNIEQVELRWSELYKMAIISSDKSVAALDPLVKKLEDYKQKVADAKNAGYLTEGSDQAFNEALQAIDALVQSGTASFEELEEARNRALGIGAGLDQVIASNKRKVGTNAVNSVKAQYDKIIGSRDNELGIGNNSAMVVEYNNAYEALIKTYDEYVQTNKLNDPEIQKALRQQAAGVQKLGRELLKSTNEAERLKTLYEDSGSFVNQQGQPIEMGGFKQFSEAEMENKVAAMKAYAFEMYGAEAASFKLNKRTMTLEGTLRENNYTVHDVAVQYNEAAQGAYAFEKAEREHLTGLPAFAKGLKEKMRAIAQYVATMTSIYRVIGEVRKGVQYVKEIDKALVELRKVTDKTDEAYDEFLQTASKTADRLGSTISAVTEATATFAKLGYTMEMAAEMAEAAIVYKNVGDNIASTEDAANSIISTLKGFGLEASEAMRIVDRFNEVGNRFAITSQGLGEALRLSASALSEGGNTLDESIGIITAANEVVNDPSSVGTALKTLTLRLRGSKTELEEMGEDVSDMATTTSQLQAKLLALTGGQVDIMLDENTFKSSTQILREMAAAWESMNDIQRASALELMGGKRQANVLSALIQNFETAEKAIEASANSAGSALRENEVYLDSIQGRIDLLTNATQTMWKNALNSDLVKWFVNLLTTIVQIVDKLGLFRTVLAGIIMYMTKKHGINLAQLFFGPKDINVIIKGLGKIKNSLIQIRDIWKGTKQTEMLALPAGQEQKLLSAPKEQKLLQPLSLVPIDDERGLIQVNTQLEELKEKSDEVFDNNKPKGFFDTLFNKAQSVFKSLLSLLGKFKSALGKFFTFVQSKVKSKQRASKVSASFSKIKAKSAIFGAIDQQSTQTANAVSEETAGMIELQPEPINWEEAVGDPKPQMSKIQAFVNGVKAAFKRLGDFIAAPFKSLAKFINNNLVKLIAKIKREPYSEDDSGFVNRWERVNGSYSEGAAVIQDVDYTSTAGSHSSSAAKNVGAISAAQEKQLLLQSAALVASETSEAIQLQPDPIDWKEAIGDPQPQMSRIKKFINGIQTAFKNLGNAIAAPFKSFAKFINNSFVKTMAKLKKDSYYDDGSGFLRRSKSVKNVRPEGLARIIDADFEGTEKQSGQTSSQPAALVPYEKEAQKSAGRLQKIILGIQNAFSKVASSIKQAFANIISETRKKLENLKAVIQKNRIDKEVDRQIKKDAKMKKVADRELAAPAMSAKQAAKAARRQAIALQAKSTQTEDIDAVIDAPGSKEGARARKIALQRNKKNNVASVISKQFADMKASVSKVFNDVKDTAQKAANSIKTTFNSVGTAIGSAFTNVFSKVKVGISNIAKSVSSTFKNIAASINNVVVKSASKLTGDSYYDDGSGFLKRAKQVKADKHLHTTGLSEIIDIDSANATGSQNTGIAKQNKSSAISKQLANMKSDASEAFNDVQDTANKAAGTIRNAFDKITLSVKNAFGGITSVAKSTANSINVTFGKVGETIGVTFTSAFNKVKGGLGNIAKSVSNTFKKIALNINNTLVKTISKLTKDAYYDEGDGRLRRAKKMGNTTPSASDYGTNDSSGIVYSKDASSLSSSGLVPVDTIAAESEKASGHINKIKQAVNGVRGAFAGIAKPSKDTFSSIADTAKAAANNIKRAFGTVSSNIKTALGKIGSIGAKAFNGIQAASTKVAAGIKKVFDKVKQTLTKTFQTITNVAGVAFEKMKNGAVEAGRALAKELGYGKKQSSQGPSSWYNTQMTTPTSIIELGGDDAVSQQIQAINDAMDAGVPALNQYMSSTQGVSDAMKAYVAQLNGAKATLPGFNAFLTTQNSLLGQIKPTTFGATIGMIGLKVATLALQTVISFGLALVIQFIINLLTKLADLIKHCINPTKKWAEELSDLKSEISDLQSEIESLNDELETTQDRMAELLAQDSLTFTEQEELENLQKQNDELEREIYLLEQKEKHLQKDAQDKFDDIMDEELANKKRDLDGDGKKDDVFDRSLERKLKKYKEWLEEYEKAKQKLVEAEQSDDSTVADIENARSWVNKTESKKDKWYTKVNDELSEYLEYADGIDYESADAQTKQYLDYIYNTQSKFSILNGDDQAKSLEIKRVFNKDSMSEAKDEIDALVEKLEKNPGDETVIAQISEQCKLAEYDLKAVGLSVQDAVDYFTKLGSNAAYNTIEGKVLEIDEATKRLNVALESVDTSNLDTIKQSLTDKGWVDTEGNLMSDAIAEYFGGEDGGISEETRSEIESLVQQIYDGKITVQDALKSFELFGVKSIIDIQIEEVKTNFKDVFVDLEDADGLISTFKELGEAVGSTADALEAFNQAQADVADKGFVSIQTALQLMEYTDDYGSVLEVVDGKLQLTANAEQNLIQARIDAIKISAQTAVADAQAAYDKAELAMQSYRAAMVEEASASTVATAWQKIVGVAAGIKNVLDNIWSGESISDLYNSGYSTYLEKSTGYEMKYDDSGLQAMSDALEDAGKKLNEAKDNAEVANALTADNLEDIFNSSDSSTVENVIKSDWEKLISKYENELALITNERDLIQAEIDKMEAQGGQASKEMYDDLIRSQLEEKQLLEEKKKELEDYLDKYGDSIDPETWTEYNNEINATAVAIKECTTNIIDFAKSLRDIDMHYFTQAIDEISRLGEEIEFVMSLFEDEDMFDEDGNWTDAGITKINLLKDLMTTYAATANMWQQRLTDLESMEIGENGLYKFDESTKDAIAEDFKSMLDLGQISKEEYDEYMSQLEDAFAAGGFSKELWTEWHNEAEDGLQDAISAGKDAQDQMIEMNDARIDAIEEGINKEIEAYEEYIDVLRESLDAERDLYDFKKNVQKQSKGIASLERRIAALYGSTNAADIAERRKLEAELNEAKEGLNDTYYDHAKDQQSQALDDEAEAFTKAKEKYVENMREAAKDTESVINDMILNGIFNADVANDFLLRIQETYNIPLSEKLTTPWATAANTAAGLKESVGVPVDNTVTMISDSITKKLGTDDENNPWNKALSMADKYADFLAGNEFSIDNKDMSTFEGQINNIVSGWNKVKKAADDAYTAQTRKTEVGGNPNAGKVGKKDEPKKEEQPQNKGDQFVKSGSYLSTIYSLRSKADIDGGKEYVDENTKKKYYQITTGSKKGYYVPTGSVYFSGKQGDIAEGTYLYTKQYAKGTMGTSHDSFAITDESWIGEEITLAAGKNGQLQYLKKGSAVMPADISANLVEWGKLNPNMMNVGGGANINMISNAVNKPELNFEFDSLVHVDNCSQDTLKDLEKMVDNKINQFSKQMNYAIKRIGGR